MYSDRLIYTGYLGLLLFAPLPFGSNITFAWTILVIWACLLGVFWLYQFLRGSVAVSDSFKRVFPLHIIWMIWLFWLMIQVITLPIGLVEIASPEAAHIQQHSAQALDGVALSIGLISLDRWATQSALLKSIAYVGIFMLTLLLVNTRQRLKLLIWVLVISGLLQALYGILSVLTGSGNLLLGKESHFPGVATGSFINRNHLAGYLVICLSLGIGLMLGMLSGEKHATWKSWVRGWLQIMLSPKFRLRLMLVVMVIALVMTHSRMGNVSFFAALLIVGVASLLLMKQARRSMTILVVSLIIIDVVIVGTWFGVDKVAQRLEQTLVTKQVEVSGEAPVNRVIVSPSDEARLLLYRDMGYYWKDFWLTGSGLGSFEYVYPRYRSGDVAGHYDHAHNDYLEFLSEAGVVGLVLLSMAVLYSIVMALIALRQRRDTLMKGMAFGSLMSMTALLIHSAVDFNLQIPSNALTFMVVLAIAILSRYMREPQGTRNAT